MLNAFLCGANVLAAAKDDTGEPAAWAWALRQPLFAS